MRPETAVPAARLQDLNESLLRWPEGFAPNAKLERLVFKRRRELNSLYLPLIPR